MLPEKYYIVRRNLIRVVGKLAGDENMGVGNKKKVGNFKTKLWQIQRFALRFQMIFTYPRGINELRYPNVVYYAERGGCHPLASCFLDVHQIELKITQGRHEPTTKRGDSKSGALPSFSVLCTNKVPTETSVA